MRSSCYNISVHISRVNNVFTFKMFMLVFGVRGWNALYMIRHLRVGVALNDLEELTPKNT